MADFKFTDRRGRGRNPGIIVGQSVAEAKEVVRRAGGRLPNEGIAISGMGDTNPLSQFRPSSEDEMLREMRLNRRIARKKTGSAAVVSGGDIGNASISFATGRPRDPLFYWRQNNIPWDISDDAELAKIRKFCRLLYLTHPIIAACTDIFTKFPLQGMDFDCKDEQLTDFYGSLFFDELDYQKYMIDVGREFWLTGEAWPLGSFNESLGVWDDDELLNPDDVKVERSLFVKEPRFLITLPESLRNVLTTQSPRWEYEELIRAYPELRAYATENARMPVSNMLLRQIKFTGDTFHKRGVPLLMRAFRAIIQEEMLNAAMDAIADRLYTPLILSKIGASASDLGTTQPWIPTADDLADFEDAVDAAMAADFRMLTYHFGVDMTPVFGREQMPNMSEDFDRIEDRILMTYGLSRTMLQGADRGETYAADALNRDVVTQLLTSYQDDLKTLFRHRALIVAEAQEHFDYDVRGGKRYVKMEEVLEVDEESGEQRIVEQPALLIPDLKFDSMNLRDQQVERDFMEGLNEAGVPVPYRARLAGTGMSLEDMIEERKTEQVALAIAEQETRRETFLALRAAGLPIPQDLAADFQPVAREPKEPAMPDARPDDPSLPTLGQEPGSYPALAPTEEDLMNEDEESEQEAGGAPVEGGPAAGSVVLLPQHRPPESDEQRAGMPKPASRVPDTARYANYQLGRIREATRANYVPPDNSAEKNPEHFRPTGRFAGPKHVGMRYYVGVERPQPDEPLDELTSLDERRGTA